MSKEERDPNQAPPQERRRFLQGAAGAALGAGALLSAVGVTQAASRNSHFPTGYF